MSIHPIDQKKYIKNTYMHTDIEKIYREKIKEGLHQLPEKWRNTFYLMYRHYGDTVEECADKMPHPKLDWALQQVTNSLKKLEKVEE